jgi:putative endopeptidase
MKKVIFASSVALILAACGTKKTNEFTTINVEYLDKSVKPQEDFFQFANGTWIKNNQIPASESRWGSFNELEQNNKAKLTTILEEAKKNPGTKGSQNQILGDYYAAYMNMELRNSKGMRGLEAEFNRVNSLKSKDQLVEIIAEHHKDGIGTLFGFGVGQDLKNVDYNILYLSQGGIGLPNKEYYTSENKKELLKAYKKHVATSLQLSGKETAQAEKAAENVLKIETMLAEQMMSPAEMRIPEKTYNKLSTKEATALFGNFDFRYYMTKVGCQSPDSMIVGNIKKNERKAATAAKKKMKEQIEVDSD